MEGNEAQSGKRDPLYNLFCTSVVLCALAGFAMTWLYGRTLGEDPLYASLAHLTAAAWILTLVLGGRIQQIRYAAIVRTNPDAARVTETTKRSFRLGLWLFSIGLAALLIVLIAGPSQSNPIVSAILALSSLAILAGVFVAGYGAQVRMRVLSLGLLYPSAQSQPSPNPELATRFASIGRNIRNLFLWGMGFTLLFLALLLSSSLILSPRDAEAVLPYLPWAIFVPLFVLAFRQAYPDFKQAWTHRRSRRAPPKAPTTMAWLQDACLAAGFIWIAFLIRPAQQGESSGLILSGAAVLFGAALLVKILRYCLQEHRDG